MENVQQASAENNPAVVQSICTDARRQFTEWLGTFGIEAGTICADGESHYAGVRNSRGVVEPQKAKYGLYLDGTPAGWCKLMRDDVKHTWKWERPRHSSDDHRVIREKIDEARRRGRQEAAEIWESAERADVDHPYLVAKGIERHGARQRGSGLIIPMKRDGEIVGLQLIDEHGNKKFRRGSNAAGAYYVMGKPSDADAIVICEGFATGASIREATEETVIVAFSAGQLESVARFWKERRPKARFVIAGDDDAETEGNPGKTKALAAARAIGALVMLPDFGRRRQKGATDFNDLMRLRGEDAINAALDAAQTPDDIAPIPVLSMTMDELIEQELPEARFLLAPLIREEALYLVPAWRGTGKTHFSMHIAYAVATGGEFLGWTADRPVGVLYLDGELSPVNRKRRLEQMKRSDNRKNVPRRNLRILGRERFKGKALPNLATPEGQTIINAEVQALDPKLIIVDSVKFWVRSAFKEAEEKSWEEAENWALQMRSQGRTVIFLHHTGKGGDQRGTSAREDAIDMVIKLTRPDGYSADQGARFKTSFEKDRNFDAANLHAQEVWMEEHAGGILEWHSKPLSTFQRVIDLLNEGKDYKQAAKELKIDPTSAWKHVRKARDEGLIKTSN